jgi:thiol:disulfide interchange protein DsbD
VLPDKTATGDDWLPFNMAILDAALDQGRPVVVDWTAAWCPNCHFFEAVVLSTDPVKDAVMKRNAVLLKADLTEDNPPATAMYRDKFGCQAIPVLAIFSPSRPHQPVVLRDGYTQSRVVDEFNNAR